MSLLYASKAQWNQALEKTVKGFAAFSKHEGSIADASAPSLLALFKTYYGLAEQLSRLGAYASLAFNSDITETAHQELYERFVTAATSCEKAAVFFDQELLSLPEAQLKKLSLDPSFAPYAQKIRELIIRVRHRLSKEEEKLLAAQSSYRGGFSKVFDALVDADMQFGSVQTSKGKVPISHASIGVLLQSGSRAVRKEAYEKYYAQFTGHLQTLSGLYASSVKQDNASAEIRRYRDALDASLSPDAIPSSLYFMLIKTARDNIASLHAYYKTLKKLSKLPDFAMYDRMKCPIAPPRRRIAYDEAVRHIAAALAPLGSPYVQALSEGLTKRRWVDRYENKGKSSGAFSYPVYGAPPYILMNYREESIRAMFTLAHEGGHSMHSQLSSGANSFAHFHYSIFCAEIASTLNEYLLYKYLIDNASTAREKKYYLWHKTADFVATFFRQTMFAEFEHAAHESAAKGVPLTAQFFTASYKKLVDFYTGPHVVIPKETAIEGLRIPHFYRNYYVYQYATGIAAATTLGARIYAEHARCKTRAAEQYLNFLKCGGSKFPLEALAEAGVEFKTNAVLQNAIDDFARDVALMGSL